jgi:thiol-disulfide isomerase/thioredoxin
MKLSSMMGALLMTLGVAASAADLPALSHSLTEQAAKEPAPALVLKDIDGQLHDLASLKGKVVLVNFWATWCPPCRREMPSMDRIARKLAGTSFAVLAVDIGEDADTIQAFFSQLDTPPAFPILLDPQARTMQTWKISGLPTTYLIDQQGRIVYTAVGGREFDHPAIEQLVRALLKP